LEEEISFMPGMKQGQTLKGEQEKKEEVEKQFAQILDEISELQKASMNLSERVAQVPRL
jgi:hypothetical protein